MSNCLKSASPVQLKINKLKRAIATQNIISEVIKSTQNKQIYGNRFVSYEIDINIRFCDNLIAPKQGFVKMFPNVWTIKQ